MTPAPDLPTFSARLIRWQKLHGRRNLPWQGVRDPYAIWLSEVMLQQTQVGTVIPYYLRFLERFPDVASLAAADIDEVLALWSGLGYYSRGRNLHRAAQVVATDHGGVFPRSTEALQQLPGIGRSTAAAIAAFAYGERRAILDGNVKRVLARHLGLEGYPGEKGNEALLWRQAEALLPADAGPEAMAVYTQALMDLGATVCTRARPRCAACPLRHDCMALREERVAQIPAPRPRRALPERETAMLMLRMHDKVLLRKRPATGIWGGLWCFPEMPVDGDAAAYCIRHFGLEVSPLGHMGQGAPLDHVFTHFKLRIHPQPLRVVSGPLAAMRDEARWMTLDDALAAAIPAPARTLLLRLAPPGHESAEQRHE